MTIIYRLEDIDNLITQTLQPLQANKTIFTLTGPLGVGKTTLLKRWLAANGVTQDITSPTFTYVNVYTNQNAQTFFHFDLYRITTEQQFVMAGFQEYIEQPDSWSFIEWPGVIEKLLCAPGMVDRVCHLELSYDQDDFSVRKMTINESGNPD